MEFVLAIIIGAVGLVLFLQRSPPPEKPRRNALGWDVWALENGWKFFPKTQDAPMTLFGTVKKYPINIYARRNSDLTDDAQDETEVRITLKYNIAEGLKIQHWDGVEETSRMARSKQLSFNREKLDQELYAEAIDATTGEWVLHQQSVRKVCEQLIELHPASRIEERSVIYRKKGLKPAEIQDAINESMLIAEELDTLSFAVWEKAQEAYGLSLRPTDQNGNPSLKGMIQDVEATISIENHNFFGFKVELTLPMSVPGDIVLDGVPSLTQQSSPIFRDSIYGSIGQYPTSQTLSRNPAFLQTALSLFNECPEASLQKRVLTIISESKKPDLFRKRLGLGLELCAALSEHFSYEEPEITLSP